jgi:predicted phosphohydrolase
MPHDYRISVSTFLEAALGEQIQTLRQRYDLKTAAITAPHGTRKWSFQDYSAPIAKLNLIHRGPADPAWRAIAQSSLNL